MKSAGAVRNDEKIIDRENALSLAGCFYRTDNLRPTWVSYVYRKNTIGKIGYIGMVGYDVN